LCRQFSTPSRLITGQPRLDAVVCPDAHDTPAADDGHDPDVAGQWRRRRRHGGDDYAGLVGDPRAVMEQLTAAQNAHDLEAMLRCFEADYQSQQPLFPARRFQGVEQVRANWSAMLEAIQDFGAEIVRSAVEGDTVFIEIHWTGTKADGTPLDVRGVIIAGTRAERIAWARLYVDDVEHGGADIDTAVRHLAGTNDD
jgi:ketosteroid isomerase-like protein